MKLQDIEDACKGQFVWSNSPRAGKLMQTNPEVEASHDTALIVFCGLSEMYGFEPKKCYEFLAIDEGDYYRMLKLYREKMRLAEVRVNAKEWDTEKNDLVQKVWVKSRLLQNRLRIEGHTYLDFGDLPNV